MANAGEIRVDATIDTRGYDAGAASITSTNSRISSSTAQAANAMNRAHGDAGGSSEQLASRTETSGARIAAIWGVVSGVAQNVVSRAFDMVKNSIGAAVDRVDTLNNFPKIMSSLGYSATDAGNQVQRMSDRLQGLPTSLDQMTGMVQKIAPLTGSLGEATDISLAFNDALLAGGKSTTMQSDAMEQYSQMLSVGKVDMMAWRSVVNAMPGQMDQLSKSILGDKANQMDLYNAMKSGKVSFQDFNNAVVNLDKQGSGHFKSFHDQAFAATGGIKTGWANMQNAINRGLADIIQNIGASNISSTIAGIGTSFEQVAKAVAPIIGNIIRFVQSMAGLPAVQGTVAALAGAFIALGTAMKITSTIQGITKAFAAFKEAQQATTLAQAAFNAVMSINPFTVIIVAIGAVVGALAYFFTQTETGRKAWAAFLDWFHGAWDNVVGWLGDVWGSITRGFSSAVDAVKGAWSGITGFFSGLWDGITQGVGGAVDGVKNAWSGIGDFFTGLWDGIKSGVQSAWDTISGAIGGALGKVGGTASKFVEVIGAVPVWIGQQLQVGLNVIFGTVTGWLTGLFDNTTGVVHDGLGIIITVITSVWQTIETIISTATEFIRTIVVAFMDILQGDWSGAWNTISTFFSGVWDGITTAFQNIATNFTNFFTTFLDTVSNVWNTVWTAVSSFFSGIWNGIVAFFTPIIQTIQNVITTALNTIQNVWNSIWTAISNFLRPIWSAISSVVSNTINTVSGVISNTLGAIQRVWNNVWSAVSGFVGNIWNGIVNAVSNGISRVAGVVGRIRDTVLGAVSGAGQWLYDTGRQIINGLGNGITSGFRWLRDRISDMGSNIVHWAESVLKVGSPSRVMSDQVGKWIPAGVAMGIDKGMPDLRTDLTRQLVGMVPTPYDMGHVIDQATSTVMPRITIPSAPASYPAPQPQVTRTVSAPITIQATDPQAAAREAARVIDMHYV